jgi:hypothetical protein
MKKFLSVTPCSGKGYDAVLPCEHDEAGFKKTWLSGGMPNTLAESNKDALTHFFNNAKVGEDLVVYAPDHCIRNAVVIRTA